MGLYVIGVIKDKSKKMVGIRLMDSETSKIKDVTIDSLITSLKNGVEVIGINIINGELTGSNGSLNRYPQIIDGKLQGKSTLIILESIECDGETAGYVVTDYKGNKVSLKVEDAIEYSEVNGIANGLVREPSGKKKHISSINGSYRVKDTKKIEITDIAWDVKEFCNFMDFWGHGYKIVDGDILILDCPNLEVLKIPKGIEEVRVDGGYTKLKKLIISDARVSLGKFLNYAASHLEQIVFSEGIELIDGYKIGTQLVEFSKLSSVTFPKGLKAICDLDFSKSQITKVNLRDGLKTLKNSFSNLKQVERINLPDSITHIEDCFLSCDSLIGINMPESLVYLGRMTFRRTKIDYMNLSSCESLAYIKNTQSIGSNIMRVKLHDSMRIGSENSNRSGIDRFRYGGAVGYYKFIDKDEAVIGEITTDIEDYMLYDSSISTDIVVKGKVKRIGNRAFGGCSSCGNINIESAEELRYIGDMAFERTKNTKEIQFNNLKVLSKIGSYAFAESTGLKFLDLSNVTGDIDIGEGAFYNSSLESIVFPRCGVVKLGDRVFEGSRLKGIVIPEGVVELGDSLFLGCRELEYIVIPKSVKVIGNDSITATGNFDTKILVYSGSEAEGICKSMGIDTITIKSISDVEKILRDRLKARNTEEDGKERKELARLLLSGIKKYEVLLTDRFINNASKLYYIYSSISQGYNRSSQDVRLITEDFLSSRLKNMTRTDKYISEIKVKEDDGSKFNVLCNYITSAFKVNKNVITGGGLTFTDEKLITRQFIYKSKKGSILRARSLGKGLTAILIIIGNEIVFATAFDGSIKPNNSYNFLTDGVNTENIFEISVASLLNKGDILYKINRNFEGTVKEQINSSISDMELPLIMSEASMINLNSCCILLGTKFMVAGSGVKSVDFTKPIKQHKNSNILCCRTGKILSVLTGDIDFNRDLSYKEHEQTGESNLDIRDITVMDIKQLGKKSAIGLRGYGIDEDSAIEIYNNICSAIRK